MVEKNKYNLFLDDIRFPETAFNYTHDTRYLKESWKIVRNFEEFCCMVDELGIPQKVSYDHDLADEHYAPEMYHSVESYDRVALGFKEKTGYDCTMYLLDRLEENGLTEHPEYMVHSMNPVGKRKILDLIESWNKNRRKIK